MVCRQPCFPHGTDVDPSVNPAVEDSDFLVAEAYAENFALEDADEAQEPTRRYWLAETKCKGNEERLLGCNLPGGFIATVDQDRRCFTSAGESSRFTLECRCFP